MSAVELRLRLVEQLLEEHAIRRPETRRAFEQVERHRFVPTFYEWSRERGWYRRVDAATAPDEWLTAVYSDRVLVTKLRGRQGEEEATSSSSAPSIMACMLEALELTPGCTVLEVGTGSGYNTALLSAIVGDDSVTTLDIDLELTAAARVALAACGYSPTVCGGIDGLHGYLPRAPYDRIIATCAVGRVPGAWMEQLRPGGVLVTGLCGPHLEGGVACLHRQPDGSAVGRLLRVVTRFRAAVGECDRAPATALPPDLANAPDYFLASFLLRLDPGAGLDVERFDALGRPTLDRYGLTVRSDGSHFVWLDSPGSEHRWEL